MGSGNKTLIVAAATDDGEKYIDRHFGDAVYYNIYELSSQSADFIKRIENTTEEERMHADPVKAKGISGTLKREGVQVAAAKVFGPNINRIKKNFVCVLVKEDDIKDSLELLKSNFDSMVSEWQKGEERAPLNLKG